MCICNCECAFGGHRFQIPWRQRQKDTSGNMWVFWNLKAHPQWHTSSNKTNSCRTFTPTENKSSNMKSVGTILLKTTTKSIPTCMFSFNCIFSCCSFLPSFPLGRNYIYLISPLPFFLLIFYSFPLNSLVPFIFLSHYSSTFLSFCNLMLFLFSLFLKYLLFWKLFTEFRQITSLLLTSSPLLFKCIITFLIWASGVAAWGGGCVEWKSEKQSGRRGQDRFPRSSWFLTKSL